MTYAETLLAIQAHATAWYHRQAPLPALPEGVTLNIDGNYLFFPGDFQEVVEPARDGAGNIIINEHGVVDLFWSPEERLVIGEAGVSLVNKEGNLLGTFDDVGVYTAVEEGEGEAA